MFGQQYRRPRTLSGGDFSGVRGAGCGAGFGDGGDAFHPVNPSLARLAEALREQMDKLYCSEVLRSLLRRTPVTLSTLLTVRRCLRPLPQEEVTRFLVRNKSAIISRCPWSKHCLELHELCRDRAEPRESEGVCT